MRYKTIEPDQQMESAYTACRLPYPSVPAQTLIEIRYRRPRWQCWLGRLTAILERVALVDADVYNREYFESWPADSRDRKEHQNQ